MTYCLNRKAQPRNRRGLHERGPGAGGIGAQASERASEPASFPAPTNKNSRCGSCSFVFHASFSLASLAFPPLPSSPVCVRPFPQFLQSFPKSIHYGGAAIITVASGNRGTATSSMPTRPTQSTQLTPHCTALATH